MSRMTVEELARADVRASAQLVDVRSATEFRAGHIPGAINIPMDEVESRLLDLDANRPIVLICQSGQRRRSPRGCWSHAEERLPSLTAEQRRGKQLACLW
jgi:rhodanese-related sulfurtransferase